ncbi:alpha-glucosidase [Escherichia coli]|uniref:alpha-glucosidase n=1 Tax=Escherichia coli TaxID=562 RepID=UPI003352AE8D
MDTPRPQLLDFQFHQNNDSFTLHFQQRLILTHSKDNPCLWIGSGIADIDMFRGNFSIKDKLQEKIALTDAIVSQSPDGWLIHFSRGSDISATLNISADDQGRLLLELQNDNLNHNRIWLRLAAQPEDHIYGCGEQFSYFDLRGKPFPLWTSEQGVGRNKQTYVTWQADCKENAGGDYYWTFFPQPTFVSTQKYYCHVDNSCYMNFDFSAPEYHELALWEDKATLRFECADTYISLLEKLTALLGRQPELPDWIYDGVTLGIQGGTEVCQKKLDTMRNAGVKVNGIWAQDWSGIRMTSFGKRVMWNWKWNSENYPQLDSRIKQWNQEGVQFLAYINPYVASDKDLCEEAAQHGYLAKDASGGDYLVEFGEFYGGAETIAHFARMTSVFTTLKPYLKEAVALNAKSGLPVMRPLFLHYEDDAHTYTLKYQYLLGRDILVAPVHEEGRSDWTLYLPEDNWVHAWTGEAFRGGEVTVNAPIGKPPVFYRADSEWAALFASLKSI